MGGTCNGGQVLEAKRQQMLFLIFTQGTESQTPSKYKRRTRGALVNSEGFIGS